MKKGCKLISGLYNYKRVLDDFSTFCIATVLIQVYSIDSNPLIDIENVKKTRSLN